MNDLFVSVIPEATCAYEMVFDQIYLDCHVSWLQDASGWWEMPILWKNNSEEYYRHLLLTSTRNLEELVNYMNKGKFLDFYRDNKLTEPYWLVFRNLTEDEEHEDDYGTYHVPVVESRWEIASGWFEWTERYEPHGRQWRKIFMFTKNMETISKAANYL